MHVWPWLKKMPSAAAAATRRVGVGKHDLRRLPAELEGDLLEVSGRRAGDQPAHLGGAGERDLVHARMRRQTAPTVGPVPVTTLTTPSGRPASVRSSARRSVERLVSSAGLTTTVLPTARAGASFHEAIDIGKFQRHDRSHDAHRLVDGVVEHAQTAAGGHRDRAALELARPSAEVPEQLDGGTHVDGTRDGDGFAVVVGLDQRELVGVGLDDVGDPQQELAAFQGREARPGGRDQARRVRPGRPVDVGLRAEGDAGERHTGRGVDRRDPPVLRRGLPLTADVVPVLASQEGSDGGLEGRGHEV